jgi:DNA polymerase
MASNESLVPAARQQLQTCLLLGVDFVPPVRFAARLPATPPVVPNDEVLRSTASSRLSGASASAGPSSTIDSGDRAALLEALRQRHERECPHCTTCSGYRNLVFGEGDPAAAIMFVGEAPGEEEDRTGRPFVGRAGQKLDEIIRAMGLRRGQVYIANVLKARPPNNRPPQPDEAARCGPFLAQQIRIIQPRVIVAMGGPATKYLLDAREGITRIRGTWFTYRDEGVEIPVMPTFHPAYLLRNYTFDTRQKVWSDMQEVMKTLGLTS